jgi:ABC-type bacteriocin/lantibiotic exporter with double-glycine peptidase domain
MRLYNFLGIISNLWFKFNKKRRFQLGFLLLLQLASTAAEMVSIGSIIPFLAVILDPNNINSNKYAEIIINIFSNNSKTDIVLFITTFFVLVIVISGTIKMLQVWFGTRVAFAIGNEISVNIYRNILYESYNFHVQKNSSELIDLVVNRTASVIYDALIPFIVCISSLLSIFGIISILYYIDSQVTIIILIYGAVFYLSAIAIASKKLEKNGKMINEKSAKMIKILQEGFGAIRHIIIDKMEEHYCQIYNKTDKEIRKSQANTYYIGILPRYLVETVGLVIMVLLAYFVSNTNQSLMLGLPVLAAVTLGIQKIMPLMHQLYHSVSSIRSGQDSLMKAVEILNNSNNIESIRKLILPIKYEENIEFRNIYFRYSEKSKLVINNFSCNIKKGMRVGIVGKSGSGKSTLVDLLLGLLIPTKGEILIDKTVLEINKIPGWQKHLSHVDQNVYMLDDNIIKNICLSEKFNKVDDVMLYKALEFSGLRKEIDNGVLGLKSRIGENGALLSGGQRQRIGIARAFYKGGDVIIFDEATSALDAQTEKEIMESLECLPKNITIFLISHKETMLKNCDMLIRINTQGDYQITQKI